MNLKIFLCARLMVHWSLGVWVKNSCCRTARKVALSMWHPFTWPKPLPQCTEVMQLVQETPLYTHQPGCSWLLCHRAGAALWLALCPPSWGSSLVSCSQFCDRNILHPFSRYSRVQQQVLPSIYEQMSQPALGAGGIQEAQTERFML